MSARATAHPWLVVAAQFRFNRVLSDELPAQAARVLALGVSVPALEELACLRPEYTDEARALFFVSLRELGIEPPNDIDAFTIVAQSIAADIVAGRVSPRDGGTEIWELWLREGYPSVPWIEDFSACDYDWNVLPNTTEELNQAILEAARDLVGGGSGSPGPAP